MFKCHGITFCIVSGHVIRIKRLYTWRWKISDLHYQIILCFWTGKYCNAGKRPFVGAITGFVNNITTIGIAITDFDKIIRYSIRIETEIRKINRKQILKSILFYARNKEFFLQIFAKRRSCTFLIYWKWNDSAWPRDAPCRSSRNNIRWTAERTCARYLRGVIDQFSSAVVAWKELAFISKRCTVRVKYVVVCYALDFGITICSFSYIFVLSAKRTKQFHGTWIVSKGAAAIWTFALVSGHGSCLFESVIVCHNLSL